MVILGASGHSSEVYDILKTTNSDNGDLFYFFDNVTEINEKFGVPVIKTLEQLETIFKMDSRYIIAVGNPTVRFKLDSLAKKCGGNAVSLIALSARISSLNVGIGVGVNIMHKVFISADTTIGYGALINAGVFIHHDVSIGAFTEIGPGTIITGGAVIGESVVIGAGAVILPKVKIVNNVVIGASATVTKDITEEGIYVGTPHKKIH